jgi:hypothetical protein
MGVVLIVRHLTILLFSAMRPANFVAQSTGDEANLISEEMTERLKT